MNWSTVLFLGLVQGLTELLPVSSSGHLVLVEKLLGVVLTDLSLETSVHVATALALCVFLRRELGSIFRSIFVMHTSLGEKHEGRTLLLNVFVGTLPAVVVGGAFTRHVETIFHDVTLTLAMLPVTGIFLFSTRWSREEGKSIGVWSALVIGLAQAVAILPGISRSGFTVGTALFLGIGREEAVRFSFLLSLPAILGGAVLTYARGAEIGAALSAQNLAVGAVAAFLSALLAAQSLLGIVRRGKLEYFAYYCIVVGIIGLVLFAG